MIPILIDAAERMDEIYWLEMFGPREGSLDVDLRPAHAASRGDQLRPLGSNGRGPPHSFRASASARRAPRFYPTDMTIDEFDAAADRVDGESLRSQLHPRPARGRRDGWKRVPVSRGLRARGARRRGVAPRRRGPGGRRRPPPVPRAPCDRPRDRRLPVERRCVDGHEDRTPSTSSSARSRCTTTSSLACKASHDGDRAGQGSRMERSAHALHRTPALAPGRAPGSRSVSIRAARAGRRSQRIRRRLPRGPRQCPADRLSDQPAERRIRRAREGNPAAPAQECHAGEVRHHRAPHR